MGLGSERGFSMVETMLVVGIIGVISAMAVFQVGASQPAIRGDSAMRVVMAQMRTARELAITERRYMRVVFTDPNTVQVVRENVPGPSTTVVGSAQLEGGIRYQRVEGLPDTPDALASAAR